MKKCDFCGKVVKDDAKLCIFCGSSILEFSEKKDEIQIPKNSKNLDFL